MKKFLSICTCLMLCLTSLLFVGCKEKPKPVAEVEAMNILNTALTNMEEAMAIKIECDNFMLMGELVTVVSENIEYSSFMGMQSWIVEEGDYRYDYSKIIYQEEGQAPEITYTKALVIEEDDDYEDVDVLSMIFDEFEDSQFSKATVLDGEYSISFKVVEEGETTNMTFVVENNTLEEVVIGSMGVSIEIEFEFGQDALEDIPQRPTNVEWIEYDPYIVVEGISTEFVVGDTLDLTDVTLEFYEDITSDWAEVFDLTTDMISGFDTTTPTEAGQTRTMTITFYGLTFDIEYTVVEAVTE